MTRTSRLQELVRSHRVRSGFTIEGLAERSGVSDRTISDIERGVSIAPRRGTMVALADGLDLHGAAREELLSEAQSVRLASSATANRVDRQPHRLTDFSGRDFEIERVVVLATEEVTPGTAPALIVLSGAPGVGKSSIAVEAAYRDGLDERKRLFVDLGGLDAVPLEPLLVLRSLLSQLTGEPDETTTLDLACGAWTAATTAKPVVVILDDAASESQVRPVLTAGNRSMVIVTSRRTLAGLDSARHLYVKVLPRDDGVALLSRIIPAEQQIVGDLDELAGLCGDLPLALRIAALRIASHPSWTVEDYARRLRAEGRRLAALTAGDTGVTATFSTSYNLLSPATRELFRSLSLLYGSSFGSAMAGALVGVPIDRALDLLDELADLGLVEVLTGDRYRLHDLLRLYASERLHAEVSPEAIAGAAARFGRWTLATAANAGLWFAPSASASVSQVGPSAIVKRMEGLRFESDKAARQWLVAEADYWFAEYQRAAEERRHSDVCDVVPAIRWFGDRWLAWGHWHEFFRIAADAAEAVGDHGAQAEALNDVAYMRIHETFEPALALVSARQALAVATTNGDEAQRAWALTHIAGSHSRLGEPELSAVAGKEAVALFVRLGDLEGELQPRSGLAVELILTDPAAALIEFDRIIEITRDPAANLSEDFRYGSRLNAMNQKVKTLLAIDRYDEALVEAQTFIDFALSTPFAHDAEVSMAYRQRGFAHLGLGHPALARADLEKALVRAGTHRPDWWALEIENALREIRASLGD